MSILLFVIFISFATLNLVFMLVKFRDRENQRNRFEEIDKFKADQLALDGVESEERIKNDFIQLRKDKIHIWKD